MNQYDSFAAGGSIHLAALAVFGVASFAMTVMGWRLRGTGGEVKMRQAIGTIGLIVWAASLVRDFLPFNFSAAQSLPLQFCDVACMVACLMFLTGHRRTQSVCCFWGIAFCLQAFLTPTLKQGPAHPAFWFFWINHAIILSGAFYCIFVGRFRPRWEDFLFATGTATVWLMFLVAYDIMTGSNYGFVGNAQPVIIDVLGLWPGRVLWIYLIGLSAVTLLWLPWHFFDRESKQAAAARYG